MLNPEVICELLLCVEVDGAFEWAEEVFLGKGDGAPQASISQLQSEPHQCAQSKWCRSPKCGHSWKRGRASAHQTLPSAPERSDEGCSGHTVLPCPCRHTHI